MIPNRCKDCGIEWPGQFHQETCARCLTTPGPHERNPLADAPPLPSQEIEAIKVAMLQTGWTWGKN
jgi:hypothetical protein